MHTYESNDVDDLVPKLRDQLELGIRLRGTVQVMLDDPEFPGFPAGVPGAVRLWEDLVFAKQMHSAAHLLLGHESDRPVVENNMAEPAAALIRHLFEAYLEIQ